MLKGRPNMGTRRTILMVLASLLAAATLLWMQSRFEAGDQRNALAVVRGYRSKAGTSIPELIARQHPKAAVRWSTTTASSCLHHIVVRAEVFDGNGGHRVYSFKVDINGPSIHPADANGRSLMAQIDGPLPPSSAAPSSAASSAATAPTTHAKVAPP